MEQSSAAARHGILTMSMIVLGLFAAWTAASDILSQWQVLALGTRICGVMILSCGVLLLSAGLLQLLTGGKRRVPAALGAIAAGLFAATLLVGILSGAIPCPETT